MEDVKIPVGVVVDEGSVRSAGKEISKTLEEELSYKQEMGKLSDSEYDSEKKLKALRNSRIQLDKMDAKIKSKITQIIDKKSKSKSERAELAALKAEEQSVGERISQNTYDRLQEEEKLKLIREQMQALKELNNMKEEARISEYDAMGMSQIAQIEKTAENFKKYMADMDSSADGHLGNIRGNFKRTAQEIKLETQKIISTFTEQPSKDFTKAENDQIKLLQQSLAKAQLDMQDAAKKLEGPWKIKADTLDLERQLDGVNKSVDAQVAKVEELKKSYEEAEKAASEIANAFQSGEYSKEGLTLEMEKIKGAEDDAKRAGKAYDEAKSKLDQLVAKQTELGNQITSNNQRYREMMADLKGDDHNADRLAAGKAAFKEYEDAADTVDNLKSELEEAYGIAENGRLMKEEDLEVAKQLEETLKGIGNEVRNIQETGSIVGESDAKKAAEAATEEANQKQIAGLKKEASAVKESAAQYYYKLRAIKMLGFVFNNATTAVDNFGKKAISVATATLKAYSRLIPGVAGVKKAFDSLTSGQKKLNKETKSLNKSNGLLGMSFGQLFKKILAYGLGIRSLYMMFRKLRKAIIDGLGVMSQRFDDVNAKMSSISTSLAQMKAAVTAAIEPILTVLAPALEKIAELVANIAFKIASFIAALTGQSMVYKAVRTQMDYAASLDKTAKSAKKAKKELAGFDELNVLHSDKDSGGDGGAGLGWDKIPIDPMMADMADKFKDFLKRLFAPIKAAWEKWKAWVLAQFKYALGELLALGRDIARDFWKVWEEYETQKIFENMFHVLGDIARIVGNLAKNFRKAWNVNNNGYRILKAIRDIILAITDSLVDMADYTVKWSENLDFIPAMTHLADAMQNKLVPAVKQVCELFETLYEQILLKIIKDFIEKGLPDLFTMAGKVAEIIGIIAEKIDFAIKSGSNGINILDKMEGLIDIVADHIQSALDKTKEWAKELDFRNLLKGIKQFLEDMKPAVEAISSVLENMWNNVLLPFWKYLIETGFPKLLENLGKVNTAADWEKITENINTFVAGLEPLFELAWDVLVQLVTDAATALSNLFKSDEFGEFAQNFKDFFTELREDETAPARIAKNIENLVKVFVEAKAALSLMSKVILPIITGIMTIGNVFKQYNMAKTIADISSKVSILAGESQAAAGAAGLGGLAATLAIVVGVIALAAAAFGGFDKLLEAIKERITDVVEYLKGFAQQTDLAGSFEHLKEVLSGVWDGLKAGVQELRPVFEVIFDLFASIAKVLGGLLISAIDGAMTSLAGLIEFLGGLGEFIAGVWDTIKAIFTGDTDLLQKSIDRMLEGLKGMANGLLDFVTGIVEFIADAFATLIEGAFPGATEAITEWVSKFKETIEDWKKSWSDKIDEVKSAIEGFFNVTLPAIKESLSRWINDTKKLVGDWVDGVKEKFAWLKNVLIGDPIVYDIEDGVEDGFGGFIDETSKGVKSWVSDIEGKFKGLKEKTAEAFKGIKDKLTGDSEEASTSTTSAFSNMAKNVASAIKPDALKKPATDYIKSFKTTITTEMKTFTGELTTMLDNITKLYQTKLSANVMSNISKVAMDGFNNGLRTGTNTAKNLVTSICNQIISAFNNKLNKDTLKGVGANLIAGLQEGMKSKTKELEETTKEMSGMVVSASKKVFDEASPSKVFKKIGQFVVEGLEIGLTQDDGYYTSFINSLSNMSVSAIDIVSDMISDMDDTFSKFEPAFNLDNTFKQLDKFKDVQMPNIVTGKMLPANARFKTDDMSNLAGALKNAIVDAMSVPSYNNYRDEQDIVIQIDGYEVFRAVRNQSDRFKNSTGYGVL